MRIRINLLILLFITIFYISNQINIYAILMFFALLHEFGHMIAGMLLHLKIDCIEIMPFGFSIRFREKDNVDLTIRKRNVRKIIVALAGPITNLIIVFIIMMNKYVNNVELIYANILIAVFNLLPIYPLDGGKIIEALLDIKFGLEKKNTYLNIITKLTMIILTLISSILVFYYENIAIFFGIIYMWLLIGRQRMKS